jgi:hypothetical protein
VDRVVSLDEGLTMVLAAKTIERIKAEVFMMMEVERV